MTTQPDTERYVIGRTGVFATLYDRQEKRPVVENATESHCRRLRDQLLAAEVRAATLTAAADGLVAGCPHHGENGGWFMTCQCEGADELRKAAAAARPDDTTGDRS